MYPNGVKPAMNDATPENLPGLIRPSISNGNELHGFEVDMTGRVIVPEFHPRSTAEIDARFAFESELQAAVDAR